MSQYSPAAATKELEPLEFYLTPAEREQADRAKRAIKRHVIELNKREAVAYVPETQAVRHG